MNKPIKARYGVENGQVYTSADGSGHVLLVVDCLTFADVDDVVVREPDGNTMKIDSFKLAMVRYRLKEVEVKRYNVWKDEMIETEYGFSDDGDMTELVVKSSDYDALAGKYSLLKDKLIEAAVNWGKSTITEIGCMEPTEDDWNDLRESMLEAIKE
jgi:hypothetical protein